LTWGESGRRWWAEGAGRERMWCAGEGWRGRVAAGASGGSSGGEEEAPSVGPRLTSPPLPLPGAEEGVSWSCAEPGEGAARCLREVGASSAWAEGTGAAGEPERVR